MLPDGTGRAEENLGKKTGEENRKKKDLKLRWGKKTDQEKLHVQTARIRASPEHRWEPIDPEGLWH